MLVSYHLFNLFYPEVEQSKESRASGPSSLRGRVRSRLRDRKKETFGLLELRSNPPVCLSTSLPGWPVEVLSSSPLGARLFLTYPDPVEDGLAQEVDPYLEVEPFLFFLHLRCPLFISSL
jgi:hypothetical protein